MEKLFDFRFHISAKAFFQGNRFLRVNHSLTEIDLANTLGAEVLYSLIKDSMKLDAETVVLDICCGTGTIGITLANVNILKNSMTEMRNLLQFRMLNK